MLIRARKQLRLPGWNYKTPGYYFVTLCVEQRQYLFGNIENCVMILNDAGQMINEVCCVLPALYSGISLDKYIIMPDHMHFIIIITPGYNKKEGRRQSTAPTLGDIIKKFNTYTTYRYRQGIYKLNLLPYFKHLWQRNYYEHIIRNNESLEKIRSYIDNNPGTWKSDDH